MIYPVTGWFEITKYRDKKSTTIENLINTMWLVWYPWPVEITYDQGGYLIGHNFRNSLIEYEYDINTKTYYPSNPQLNVIIERINQVLGNLVLIYNLHDIYTDDADQ